MLELFIQVQLDLLKLLVGFIQVCAFLFFEQLWFARFHSRKSKQLVVLELVQVVQILFLEVRVRRIELIIQSPSRFVQLRSLGAVASEAKSVCVCVVFAFALGFARVVKRVLSVSWTEVRRVLRSVRALSRVRSSQSYSRGVDPTIRSRTDFLEPAHTWSICGNSISSCSSRNWLPLLRLRRAIALVALLPAALDLHLPRRS